MILCFYGIMESQGQIPNLCLCSFMWIPYKSLTLVISSRDVLVKDRYAQFSNSQSAAPGLFLTSGHIAGQMSYLSLSY